MSPEELAKFLHERDQALTTLDLEWARKMFRPDADNFTLLVAMHKVRYNTPALPDALRHESAAWLRANEMSDLHGIPLLPPGELPDGPKYKHQGNTEGGTR